MSQIIEPRPKVTLQQLFNRMVIAAAVFSLLPVGAAVYTYPNLMAAIGLLISMVTFLAVLFIALLKVRAERLIQQEREYMARVERVKASRQVIQGDKGQTWVTEIDARTGEWVDKALHLQVKPYSNGHYEAHTKTEWEVYLASMTNGRSLTAQRTSGARAAHEALVLPQNSAQSAHLDLVRLATTNLTVMVVGIQEAGKTNVLHHVIPKRLREGPVYIVDPHGNRDHWPAAVQTVGMGLDYAAVSGFMKWIGAEVKRRYEAVKADPLAYKTFKPMTIIVDEWTDLRLELPEITTNFMKLCLINTRKVGINTVIGGHSDLVDGLGLKGASDMKQGLVTIKLYYKKATGERRATVDFNDGDGEHPLPLPPLHPDLPRVEKLLGTGVAEHPPEQTDLPDEQGFKRFGLSEDAQAIYDYLEENLLTPADVTDRGSTASSLRDVARNVFDVGDEPGQKKFNSYWSDRIKTALAEIEQSGILA